MLNQQESNFSAIAPFVYLFFTDIAQLVFKTYPQYETKEPGFAIPFLHAYIAAFQEKSTGKISHEILKKINKLSLKHLNTSSAGEYRTEAANFPISISQVGYKRIPTYSASIEGILQFLSFWIIDNLDPIHTLSLSINDISKDHTLTNFMVRAHNGNVLALQGHLEEKSVNLFDANKHYVIIKELLSNPDYKCTIDSAPYLENHLIQSTLQSKMQSIIDEFEEDICGAITADEKIYIIAKHVQRIEQLHPFLDGNIRTCYILINKLLRDFEQPLTILFNPNKLDACTIEEVVEMIKIGQLVYQDLLTNTNPDLFLIKSQEFNLNSEIICTPQNCCPAELLENFYRIVIQNRLVTSNSRFLQNLTVFSHRPGSLASSLLLALQPLIDKNNPHHVTIEKMIYRGSYSLAFRNACATKSYSLIQAMLPYLNTLAIDLNETSKNGNTSLDWLDWKLPDSIPEEHIRIRTTLIDQGALTGININNRVRAGTPMDSY